MYFNKKTANRTSELTKLDNTPQMKCFTSQYVKFIGIITFIQNM